MKGSCSKPVITVSVENSTPGFAASYYSIRGKLYTWLRSKQRVVVNGTSSDWSALASGVPQGTVLGLVLFLLYINDLSSNVKLFADDSTVYRQIQRVEDHSILQQDLLNLEQWASLWQMNFAPSKCYTLSVTLKKKPSPFVYSLCDSNLEGVKFQKYLSVYISSTLSWAKQCEEVKKKASRILGVLQRNLSLCSETVKERAYMGLVRPIAEYASAAWSPHTKKDVSNIESIQRRAARFVCGDYDRTSSVTSMTRDLGWSSLQSRRTVHDLTLFYKTNSGEVIIPFPPELVPTERRTRASQQHQLTFIHPWAAVDSYKYSFFVRTVPYWNSLPPTVVNANSLKSFYSQINNMYCH